MITIKDRPAEQALHRPCIVQDVQCSPRHVPAAQFALQGKKLLCASLAWHCDAADQAAACSGTSRSVR